MFIYLVESGEQHEGGHVTSVHKNYGYAWERALDTKTNFEGGWVEVREDYWENGCDFVRVVKLELEK